MIKKLYKDWRMWAMSLSTLMVLIAEVLQKNVCGALWVVLAFFFYLSSRLYEILAKDYEGICTRQRALIIAMDHLIAELKSELNGKDDSDNTDSGAGDVAEGAL